MTNKNLSILVLVGFVAGSTAFADKNKGAGVKVETDAAKVQRTEKAAAEKNLENIRASEKAALQRGQDAINAARTPITTDGAGKAPAGKSSGGDHGGAVLMGGKKKAASSEGGDDMPIHSKGRTTTADADAKKAEQAKMNAAAVKRAEDMDKMDTSKEGAELWKGGKITLSGAERVLIEQLSKDVYGADKSKMTPQQIEAFNSAVALYLKNVAGPHGEKGIAELKKALPEIAAILKNAKSDEERVELVRYFMGSLALYGNTGSTKGNFLLGVAIKKFHEAEKNPEAFEGLKQYLGAAINGSLAYAKTHEGSAYKVADARSEMRGAMKDWAIKRLTDNKIEDAAKVEKDICDCTEGCPLQTAA